VRKRAEEQIRFQRRLLDAIGQAIIATDLPGRIIYWNRAAKELYGWSTEEVMGRPIVEVTPSEETFPALG
jgi:PAS domain S-box-containing protein